MSAVKIRFEQVRKEFVTRGEGGRPAGRFTALEDITLDVRSGEFLALVGPSGCGKSTLLDLLGGLTTPTIRPVRCTSPWRAGAVRAAHRASSSTGRPPRWIPPVVDALGLSPLAVCANGAVLYDSATDRIVSAHTLSPDALGELAEIATRVGVVRSSANAHR